jgi:aromatic ring-opening dioxygenase catalytic subunit (LigB family)
MSRKSSRLPTLFISHGGGPCFFLEPGEMFPPGTWDNMAAHLRRLQSDVGAVPKALLVVSAHWEQRVCTVYSPLRTKLLYDYYGFPPAAYALTYPAAGSPSVGDDVRTLLTAAGISSAQDEDRGFDHGVFIPMKLAFPEADIPIVQLSLRTGLDAATHLAIGAALAPLRDREVLIVGSGMSYHNLRALSSPSGNLAAQLFDQWLNGAVTGADPSLRNVKLTEWACAPGAQEAHPRAEHLAPLLVASGAAGEDIGQRTYSELVFGKPVSSFQFGTAA